MGGVASSRRRFQLGGVMEWKDQAREDVVGSASLPETFHREGEIASSSDGDDHGMKLHEIIELPVVVDLTTAGRAWRLGRTKSHELARAGDFPCRVLRVGSQYRVTRTDLLTSLGIDDAGPADPGAPRRHTTEMNEQEKEVNR